MTLRLPRYEASVSIDWDRITRALLNVDQFDDWLPDPVFYDDLSVDTGRVISRVRSTWQAGSVPDPAVERVALPRASGAALTALALPLEARLCAHAVMTTFAPRVAGAVPRDKVYGFRLLRAGPKMYDAPGDELDQVFEAVAAAARVATGGAFELLDVVAFNASARPDRLAATLQQCGATGAECELLRSIVESGGTGLPSIDDAFAFAYNFYLQPVDATLVQQKQNFFRYRDEYFVFDPAAKQTVLSRLTALGLQARSVARSVDIEATIGRMNERLGRTSRVKKTLVNLPQGVLEASVSCNRIGADDCTDYDETISFNEYGVSDRLRRAAQKSLDAVDMLPALRRLNTNRRAGVLSAPPYEREARAVADHRAALASDRGPLRRLLSTGVATGASWQVGWAATLLSDLGRLTDDESALLLRVVGSRAMDETAKVQARIALARSSTLPAERFWSAAIPTTEYRRRGMLLAARHLARRNAAPWNMLRQAIGDREPELVQYLTANINVRL